MTRLSGLFAVAAIGLASTGGSASAADVLAGNWKVDGAVATCQNQFPAGSTITIYCDKFHGKSVEFGFRLTVNGQDFVVRKAGDVLRARVDDAGRIVIRGDGKAAASLGVVEYTRENLDKTLAIFLEVRVVVSL